MKFTIITVTYNSRDYLEETITSVLSQDDGDFEYIIVDGGSRDGTLEIIRRFAESDPRIRWISEPDDGIADAFNKGLGLARGEIVGILNSDDRYLAGALARVSVVADSQAGCDVFHGDMLRLDGESVLFRLIPADVEKSIWHEMPLNHPATFVTRRAYQRTGGFDAALKFAMDYDLLLRLYKGGNRFCHIPHSLAAMRYGGASDSNYIEGLREVRAITIREGYPRTKAWFWFLYKVGISSVKNLLRCLGLFGLIRLHPRFRKSDAGN